MLLYNKSIDPYHTLLRMVSILVLTDIVEIEEERLRILDFLISNPSHIHEMSLPKNLLLEKNYFKKFKNSYCIYNPISLFESMKPIQRCVISSLIAMSVLSQKNNSTRYVINKNSIPLELVNVVNDDDNSISRKAIAFIRNRLVDYELLGDRGLKAASKIMDYRYDAT